MLKDEIDAAQRLVKTDAYQLSIGEVVNMYRGDEFIINPDFQRLFRWELGQKSRLIESLLLGIPLPSIFVFEREDATWELIDGLQRISTLLEFMGELKDPATGQLKAPTALVANRCGRTNASHRQHGRRLAVRSSWTRKTPCSPLALKR